MLVMHMNNNMLLVNYGTSSLMYLRELQNLDVNTTFIKSDTFHFPKCMQEV